jgi:hypothetical protein
VRVHQRASLYPAGRASLSLSLALSTQGTATAAAGQAECSACGVGTYSGEAGATACLPCANGTVAAEPGARRCDACPAGKVPLPAAGRLPLALWPHFLSTPSHMETGGSERVVLRSLPCGILQAFRQRPG